MPANIIKPFADKSGKSEEEVERLWKKAKQIAVDDGRAEEDENFYPYVVGILKKMLNIESSMANITTTSVGNAATPGGSANFAFRMGTHRDKEKKKEEEWRKFLKKYA